MENELNTPSRNFRSEKFVWSEFLAEWKTALNDHFLATFPSKVSQKRAINVGFSDHEPIFCTRKISRFKTGGVHKYINFHSLKNYRADDYKKCLPELRNVRRRQCSIFRFISKVMTDVDKIAPHKIERVKGNSQQRFEGEVLDKLNSRDKRFQKFKNYIPHIDKSY